MDQPRTCPQCGAELPRDAMAGVCPTCMARVVFGAGQPAPLQPAQDEAATLRVELPTDDGLEHPGTMIGRYKLLEKIGEGGFGLVYTAEQVEPVRRMVALKVIKAGMDTREVIARFEAERQALALMDHPNIARILDAGVTGQGAEVRGQRPEAGTQRAEAGADASPTSDLRPLPSVSGRPYFVMELVKGIPITTFCDEKKLSPTERLQLFIKVCAAVQHAHQKAIIHRDIKPSNVLVTLHDGEPVPKVIDFGIAKALGPKLTEKTLFTRFAHLLGTPAYMSPEQAELSGLDIDTRSDIYSLGVLLYELLTGVTPFERELFAKAALDEIRRMIRETEPPKPSTRLAQQLVAAEAERRTPKSEIRNPKSEMESASARRLLQIKESIRIVRGDLDWIVMKCLEKDRKRRYETANGLALDLQRHLNHEPVAAAAPTAAYRAQKFIGRHKTALAVAGSMVLLLLAGAIVSAWQAFRATRAERKAQSEASKSSQVAQFLKDMLEGVGPSKAKGRDTTMLKEILEKTAVRVSRDLKDQPEIEAELLHTLGEVSIALEEFDKAEARLSRAVDLRKKLFGEEHAELANSLDSLAQALYGQGRLAKAENIGRQALAMQRKTRGNHHTNVATSLNNLGITLTVAGRWNEAETAYREALTIRTNLLGNEHPEVAVTLNCFAEALTRAGRLREAEVMERRALAILKKQLGDNDPDVAICLKNLANIIVNQGKLDLAEPLYREAIVIERFWLGNQHSELATTLQNCGVLLERMGLWAQAEALQLEALAIRKKLFTNDDHRVAFSLNNLANLRAGMGQLEEAETLHQQALAMRRRLYGEDNADVATSIGNLARVLRQQSRLAEAERMQNDALARRRKLQADGEHLSVAVSLNELGLVLQAQGRLPETGQKLREAFNLRTKLLGSDDSNLAESAENLALLLCELGEFAEAGKLARQGLAIRELNYPDDWRRYNAFTIVGTALLGQKQFAEAERLLLSGFEGMKQREDRIPSSNNARLKETLERLVQLHEATGQSEKVAEWKKKLEAFGNAPTNAKPAALPKP